MNMDFKSAKELLDLCEENQLPISEVMRQRECLLGETPRDAVDHRMAKAWEIMRASATQPLKKPIKSMGGLIGGEAKKLETHYNKKKNICGDVLQKAMTYAMAVLEVNASMGLIVAAPTAGSAGVVPGMMLALQECYRISDQRIVDALFTPVPWAILPCATPPWPVPWAAVRPRWALRLPWLLLPPWS